MGYNTQFEGCLKFTQELTGTQLAALNLMLEEDCREHPEWGAENLTHIDLQLTNDFSGIEWNGAEKTYDLVEKVNLIICEMKKVCPDFGLEGQLLAQGEEFGDIWKLIIGEDGFARSQKLTSSGNPTTCPHCGEDFIAP